MKNSANFGIETSVLVMKYLSECLGLGNICREQVCKKMAVLLQRANIELLSNDPYMDFYGQKF